MLHHIDFIEKKLKAPIKKKSVIEVGVNLNDYISFEEANEYAGSLVASTNSKDKARQEKSSKDSILGKLVEEIIIYLLKTYFENSQLNYVVTNNKKENNFIEKINNSLCIKRSISNHIKYFDSDIIIYKLSKSTPQNFFILSVKGTTRERIGQFLSHLFLMDKSVLDTKYGKDKYEVMFEKENIRLKYAFVTLDWAKNKDFIKHNPSGKLRDTVKTTEVQLILDDCKLGGGIYVINNLENIDGIGKFGELVGKISDYLGSS